MKFENYIFTDFNDGDYRISIEDAETEWLFDNSVDYNIDEDGKYDYYGKPIDESGIYYKIGVEPDIVEESDLEDYCVYELGLKVPDFDLSGEECLDFSNTMLCVIALENAGYSIQPLNTDLDWIN